MQRDIQSLKKAAAAPGNAGGRSGLRRYAPLVGVALSAAAVAGLLALAGLAVKSRPEGRPVAAGKAVAGKNEIASKSFVDRFCKEFAVSPFERNREFDPKMAAEFLEELKKGSDEDAGRLYAAIVRRNEVKGSGSILGDLRSLLERDNSEKNQIFAALMLPTNLGIFHLRHNLTPEEYEFVIPVGVEEDLASVLGRLGSSQSPRVKKAFEWYEKNDFGVGIAAGMITDGYPSASFAATGLGRDISEFIY